jgi:methylated-DNA-[protein]-cysteine S-methyltransferase
VEAALRAFAPQISPPELGGADLCYVLEESAVGRLLLAAHPDGRLVTCAYAPDDAEEDRLLDRVARRVSPRLLRGGRALDEVRRQLAEYLSGHRRRFDVALDLSLASSFQQQVLGALAHDVGYGRTASYADLARGIGRPSASRAVGAALGANPLCVVLPCHRVVASTGVLTGYAGGIEAKRHLLELERVATRDR